MKPGVSPIPRLRLTEARRQRQWSQTELAEQVGTTQVNVSRWERGITKPTPYFRKKLCVLFGKTPYELGLSGEQTVEPPPPTSPLSPDQRLPLWYVPFPRNPFFTGREDMLQRVHKILHQKRTLTLTQSLAVSGLGGIGKTQIALEYAYQYRQ